MLAFRRTAPAVNRGVLLAEQYRTPTFCSGDGVLRFRQGGIDLLRRSGFERPTFSCHLATAASSFQSATSTGR